MNLPGKLKRPYYLEASLQKRLALSFLFALFIFLFLYLFRPFGLNQVPGLASVSLGYGLCTGIAMLILYAFLPVLLPSVFDEEKWNIGKQITWTIGIVSSIGILNAWYSIYAGIAPDRAGTYLWYGIYTFLIGLFPVSATVLIDERRQFRKFTAASSELNEDLENHSRSVTQSQLLIPSENKSEELRLLANELLFIRAADNYAEVYYMKHGKTDRKLLRNSLKKISDALPAEHFFRCHKSYIVNMEQVSSLSGNAQGYRLHLRNSPDTIPVSRSLNEELKNRLHS